MVVRKVDVFVRPVERKETKYCRLVISPSPLLVILLIMMILSFSTSKVVGATPAAPSSSNTNKTAVAAQIFDGKIDKLM